MLDTLRAMGLLRKKVVIPVVSVICLIGVGGYATYDAIVNTPDKADLKNATNTTLKGGQQSAEKFNEDSNMDLPSMEEVSNFIGTLGQLEPQMEKVDKEYGKNTYEYYSRGLLPESNDSDLLHTLKRGNIEHFIAEKKDKDSVVHRDAIPIAYVDNTYQIDGQYYVSEIGFKKFNSKINYGYITGSLSSDAITGQSSYKDGRTNFEVNLLVYPKMNMTLAELEKEANKIPIVVNGTTLEPYFTYYSELQDAKGKSYSKYFSEAKVDSNLTSYFNINHIFDKNLEKRKVYSGVAVRLTFVGNVKNYFSNKDAEMYPKSTTYKEDTLPLSIDISVDDNKKTLKKIKLDENESYRTLELKP